MTTIAFDGTHLATDTLVSEGDYIYGYTDKIHQVKGGVLAAAGSIVDASLVIEWINDGRPKDRKPNLESFNAIFIPDSGEPVEYDERLVPMFVVIPWSGGSGRNFALSAMKLGKSAHDAVEFAKEIDLHSGGDVISMRVRG